METLNKQALAYANLLQLGTTMIAKAGSAKISGRLVANGQLGEVLASRMQMTINKKTETYNDK